MMMRAQKPLTFSVGPFYIMSTETAIAVSGTFVEFLWLFVLFRF